MSRVEPPTQVVKYQCFSCISTKHFGIVCHSSCSYTGQTNAVHYLCKFEGRGVFVWLLKLETWVEERLGVDHNSTHCAALHESFTSKNTCVKADLKHRTGLRFMLNIADTDHLKMSSSALIPSLWDHIRTSLVSSTTVLPLEWTATQTEVGETHSSEGLQALLDDFLKSFVNVLSSVSVSSDSFVWLNCNFVIKYCVYVICS